MSWSELAQIDKRAYARKLQAQEKMTILNNATLTVDFHNEFNQGYQTAIFGADRDESSGQFYTGDILLTGGTLHVIATDNSESYAIWNYLEYSPEITIKNTNLILDNYYTGFYFKSGVLNISSDMGKGITLNDTDYCFILKGDSKVKLENLITTFNNTNAQGIFITNNATLNINKGNVDFSNVEHKGTAFATRESSSITLEDNSIAINNFNQAFNLKGNSSVNFCGHQLKINNTPDRRNLNIV